MNVSDIDIAYANADDLDVIIQNERIKELFLEGHRLFDITRRHEALSRDAACGSSVLSMTFPDDRFILGTACGVGCEQGYATKPYKQHKKMINKALHKFDSIWRLWGKGLGLAALTLTAMVCACNKIETFKDSFVAFDTASPLWSSGIGDKFSSTIGKMGASLKSTCGGKWTISFGNSSI